MSVFENPEFDDHETVAFFDDRATGLRAIIAIHSTALGPACGGVRMHAYVSGDEALDDVLRLSRAMSYKSAIANLPFGGGKAVILGDPAKDKNEARLLAFGGCVNALSGRYIAAMDVGILPADMPVIAKATKHIGGYDQPGRTGGDSGPPTALGVFMGLKSAVKHRLGVDTTADLTVAIQGLGKVGMNLAERLRAEGARLVIADTDPHKTQFAREMLGAEVLSPEEIITAPCDVLSPNALGGILNEKTVPALHARVIAGGANNQLAAGRLGETLRARDILYAPDYVINGGGIIRVAGQIFAWPDEDIERRVLAIADTLKEIFRRADSEGLSTHLIADRMAEERMAAGSAQLRAAQ